MALIKSKELSNGLVGEYWVAESKINMVSKKTEIIMLLFKDKVSRDAGKQFILRERLNDIEGIYLTGEQVYSKIKESRLVPDIENDSEELIESNWFADAKDC